MIDDFHYSPPLTPWLAILYCDADLVVVDKPAGLLSVPGRDYRERDSIQHRMRQFDPKSRPVHRLDLDTSGLILLARHKDALRDLGRQFEERLVSKTYVAHVEGVPDENTGTIDLPLCCDWENRPLQHVDHERGKPAITRWEKASWKETPKDQSSPCEVTLYPETGRSHQLRVHMAAIGHPICGDRFYNAQASKAPRLMLHAQTLAFKHPSTKESLVFNSQPGWHRA